jgi:hypothetical protein
MKLLFLSLQDGDEALRCAKSKQPLTYAIFASQNVEKSNVNVP